MGCLGPLLNLQALYDTINTLYHIQENQKTWGVQDTPLGKVSPSHFQNFYGIHGNVPRADEVVCLAIINENYDQGL